MTKGQTNNDDELQQFHKVTRRPTHYTHEILVKYPKTNVNNMLEKWQESKENSEAFLVDAEKLYDMTIEQGVKQLNDIALDTLERIKQMEALSPEERAKKLEEEWLGYAKLEKEKLENIDKEVEAFKDSVRKEVDGNIQKHKSKITEMKSALDMWQNPVTEKEQESEVETRE